MTDYVISSGATASYAVAAGDTLTVLSGGHSSGSTVASGGVETVAAGGWAIGDTVFHGGVEALARGAHDSGVTIRAGGVLDLETPRISAGVSLSIGRQSAQATLSGATLSSGAVVDASGAIVLGDLYVSSGGTSWNSIVSSGGTEVVASGGVVDGATVKSFGALQVSGTLEGEIIAAGLVVGGTLASGGDIVLGKFGSLASATILSGATVKGGYESQVLGGTLRLGAVLELASGSTDNGTALAGGSIIDDGAIYLQSGTASLAGDVSGTGQIDESGGGTTLFQAAMSGFHGFVHILNGVVDVRTADGLGSATVEFDSGSGSQTLRIEGADRPATGGTFATPLRYFTAATEAIDLRGLKYVAGATIDMDVTNNGSTITLVDGKYKARFELSVGVAPSYQAIDDGAGGTLIRPVQSSAAAGAIIQAAAGFGALPEASEAIGSHTFTERLDYPQVAPAGSTRYALR